MDYGPKITEIAIIIMITCAFIGDENTERADRRNKTTWNQYTRDINGGSGHNIGRQSLDGIRRRCHSFLPATNRFKSELDRDVSSYPQFLVKKFVKS